MANYYEVSVPRAGKEGKTFWRRIGTAFPAKNGDGMNVELDALPLPDKDGRCGFIIRPPQEKEQSQQNYAAHEDLNDSVPF